MTLDFPAGLLYSNMCFIPLPVYVYISAWLLFLHVCWCARLCAMCIWQDLLHGRIQMKTLTNKWYEEVRQGPSGSEDDEDEAELLWTEQALSVSYENNEWTLCALCWRGRVVSEVCSPATEFMWQKSFTQCPLRIFSPQCWLECF